MTLREKLNGEKKGGGEARGKAADVKSILRMQHLQNISLWAGGEASMPSYAAFLGNRLATCGEDTRIALDSSLFPCQRCESILQPGFNCSVRIETNGAKVRRRRNKVYIPPKNIVVYTCHFCSHRNVKKGTPKRHMKEIFSSKSKPVSELEFTSADKKLLSSQSAIKGSKDSDKKPLPVSKPNSKSCVMHPQLREEVGVENSPTTPKLVLLEGKRKKRKNKGSAPKEEQGAESSRKRRKGWTSLKEIAENSETANKRDLSNIPLPLFL